MKPNIVLNLHGLNVVILPGAGVPKEARKYYEEAYEAWKRVWKDTLLELDGNDKLFSDHFTRQDYHLTIFHGSRCVTAVSFRRIDLQSKADLEDSWLKLWPQEILNGFKHNLKNGLMTSWFYVDPEYRRAEADNHLATLQVSKRVTEMISFFSRELGADVTLGGVRNNRSVNKLIEPTGCKVVLQNLMNHGVEIDLVTWLPVDVESAIKNFSQVTHRLWENRMVFNSEALHVNPRASRKKSA